MTTNTNSNTRLVGQEAPVKVESVGVNIEGLWFVNGTPHDILLTNGVKIPRSGILVRVAQSISDFDKNLIATQSFGEVTGLPAPQPGVIYIVSALVLPRAQAEGRTDVVAPATGHKKCIRDEGGRIVSVPGFLR